jgi:hypothetical protein
LPHVRENLGEIFFLKVMEIVREFDNLARKIDILKFVREN